MGEHDQSTWRGVLIGDERAVFDNIDTTNSDYTEAGPHPGIPEAQQDTEMTLTASGEQSTDGALRIVTTKAGFAEQDGAGFYYYEEGGSKYGWEPPNSPGQWEAVNWTTDTTDNRYPHVITLADDQAMVVYSNNDATDSEVCVHTRTAANVWGAQVEVFTEDADGANYLWPFLLPLASGRVLCFAWTLDGTNNTAQVTMYYSDDDGATWTLGSKACLPADLSTSTYTVGRLRGAIKDGQILMIASLVKGAATHDDMIIQYASSDLGAAFVIVDELAADAATTSIGYTDVVATSDTFIVSYVYKNDDLCYCVRLASAYESFSDATAIKISDEEAGVQAANIFTDGDGSTFIADDGKLYHAFRSHTGATNVGRCWVFRSIDDGKTWAGTGDLGAAAGGYFWYGGDDLNYPINFSATWQRGRAIILHNWVAANGNEDWSLGCFYSGGYTTHTRPPVYRYRSATTLKPWLYTWLPFELPGSMTIWTKTETNGVGGAEVESLDSPGVLSIATANAAVREYENATIFSSPLSTIGQATWSVSAGKAGIEFEADDGANFNYEVAIRLSTTALEIYDLNAGAQLATAAVTGTANVQVRWATIFATASSSIAVWYRAFSTDEERAWTLLGVKTNAQDDGTVGLQTDIRWGNIDSSAACASKWVEFGMGGDSTPEPWADGFTNPDDLFWRDYSPSVIYVSDGVRLAATDGPTLTSDEWDIDAIHDYPIENIHPAKSPSPNSVWRSTTAADQSIIWTLDDIGDADFPGDILGVYIECNAPYIVLARYVSGGWATLYTVPLYTAVTWTVVGQSLELTYSATEMIVEENEFEDSTLALGTGAAATTRAVTRNTSGSLMSSGTPRKPRFYCDDITGIEAEYAAGTGTGHLYHKKALILISLAGKLASRFRITFGKSATAPVGDAGYHQCGVAVVGPIYPLTWDPSATRSTEHIPNTTISTSRNGKRRSRVRGPMRRRTSMSWNEGVETSDMYGYRAGHVLASDASNAEPVGNRGDVPIVLRSLWAYLDGPGSQAVLIPRLPHLLANNQVIVTNNCGGAIYGRITEFGPVQSLLTRSTEEESEIVRLALVHEEEV